MLSSLYVIKFCLHNHFRQVKTSFLAATLMFSEPILLMLEFNIILNIFILPETWDPYRFCLSELVGMGKNDIEGVTLQLEPHHWMQFQFIY